MGTAVHASDPKAEGRQAEFRNALASQPGKTENFKFVGHPVIKNKVENDR